MTTLFAFIVNALLYIAAIRLLVIVFSPHAHFTGMRGDLLRGIGIGVALSSVMALAKLTDAVLGLSAVIGNGTGMGQPAAQFIVNVLLVACLSAAPGIAYRVVKKIGMKEKIQMNIAPPWNKRNFLFVLLGTFIVLHGVNTFIFRIHL